MADRSHVFATAYCAECHAVSGDAHLTTCSMSDPRTMTLGDYSRNIGGEPPTYNTARTAEWLFAAATGKLLKPGEAEGMVAQAMARAADRKALGGAHEGGTRP